MDIHWSPTKNFSTGRSGKKIIGIVNHITSGAFPGCLSWLQNPAAKSSAHYIVTRTGAIYQLVKDEDTSWHAGIVNKPNWALYDGKTNPNKITIGIEHEGYGNNGGDGTLTEAQYQATLWLHKQLIAKHGIVVDKDHIIGHYRIDSVNRPNCPGPNFPWTRLLGDLQNHVVKEAISTVAGMFKDVPDNHPAKASVEKYAQLGIVKGDTQGNFNPDAPVTRAQVVVILDRAFTKFMGK